MDGINATLIDNKSIKKRKCSRSRLAFTYKVIIPTLKAARNYENNCNVIQMSVVVVSAIRTL